MISYIDDSACVDYLTDWNRRMFNVDLTDDFKTEREKIRSFCDANYPLFSEVNYTVKEFVGAIDVEIDILNESDQITDANDH